MNKEIAALYKIHQEYLLCAAAERYGLDRTTLKPLGSFESFVIQSENLVLKITHSIRRSKEYLLGELEFVQFLAENGVAVAYPVPSSRSNLVETIALENGYFLIYAFQKAKGAEPSENELDVEFYEQWGRLTGQIHALTKQFQPSQPAYKRQEWYQEDVLDYDKYVPASQQIVHQKKEKIFRLIHSLPINRDCYGLTHNDIHYGNIFLADGGLTVFDFDDCSYHWFINDIAIAIHSVLPGYDQEAQFDQIAEHFLTHFLKGYYQENQLDPVWFTYLPDFLRLYDLINYGIFYQTWDMINLSAAWQNTLNRVRHRIENEICIIGTEFEKLFN
jgi:Ser/Thr protein kinase RdoA (MazF antagonist)